MTGAQILLIEDDEVLCDLMKRNLTMRQHKVSTAVDARSALDLLREHSFDLILLDINLPDQTGWDILRTAQQNAYLHPIVTGPGIGAGTLPVVILSAVRVSPRRLAEFHPLAYLPKPFPMEAVIRLAAEAAERRNATALLHQNEVVDNGLRNSSEEELHA